MEPISLSQCNVNIQLSITCEEVAEITVEKVKEYSDFLFNQKVISEEEQMKLQQCSTFEKPQYDKTEARMIKILDFFLLINGLNDSCKLTLQESVKDKLCPNTLEKMIVTLKTNAEIDQKMESTAQSILKDIEFFITDVKKLSVFDQTLDYLLVTGQFVRVNFHLKNLAEALKGKGPSVIDEIARNPLNFTLVNIPCWASCVRKVAIQMVFRSVISAFKIEEIKKHIKILTTRFDTKSQNYKVDIDQYLSSEVDKLIKTGYEKRSKVIKLACSAFMSSQESRHILEFEAKNEEPYSKSQETIISKKEKSFNSFSNYSSFNDIRPLLGDSKTMMEVAEESEEWGNVQTGLYFIDPEYTFRSIRGDGHCMFRAVLAGLLMHLEQHSEEKEKIIVNLTAFPEQQKEFLECFNLMKQNNSFESILRNRTISDKLVKAIRVIAVTYEEDIVLFDLDGPMRTILNSDEAARGNIPVYLNQMKDMSGKKIGGAPELYALEKVLEIGINVLDADSSGIKGKIIKTAANDERNPAEGKIHILRRGFHYDLAVPKKELI